MQRGLRRAYFIGGVLGIKRMVKVLMNGIFVVYIRSMHVVKFVPFMNDLTGTGYMLFPA
jgi:hypothetical protein